MKKWQSKYNEKVGKGYRDVTSLRKVVAKGFKETANSEFNRFLTVLRQYSKTALAETYTVSSDEVTQAQVDRAQEILNDLSRLISGSYSNSQADSYLKDLYMVIPRKMANVRDHLVNGDLDTQSVHTKLRTIIQKEQDNVDNMAQAVSAQTAANTSDQDITYETALGIQLTAVAPDQVEVIKKLLGSNVHQFVKAFGVTNFRTHKNFEDQKPLSFKDWTRLLWHGSRNENWLSIVSKGLMIRPTGAVFTGSMFGNGIYFANKAQKSIGYTSLDGSYWAGGRSKQAFLALYEVNTGMEYRTQTRDNWMASCDEKMIKAKSCDSLYAMAGSALRNDEFIVYNHNQCTIKYIVEIQG